MDRFEQDRPFWRFKTDLTKAEKAEYSRHFDLAIRLTLWWEEHAYFADIASHWYEHFEFGEFNPITRSWETKHHRKLLYSATAKDGRVVPIRDYFEPKTVADSVVGTVEVRTSKLRGYRQAYAEVGVCAYPNWPSETVRFLHVDVDYPRLKKVWKEQGRPDPARLDLRRDALAAEEHSARESDRAALKSLGALVVDSITGLHAHFYLSKPVNQAEGRALIEQIDGFIVGHVEQTNLGALGNWENRQRHLPLPLPRKRQEAEYMRVPQALLDYFVDPLDWQKWRAVQIDPGTLAAELALGAPGTGSGVPPSLQPPKVGAVAPAALDLGADATSTETSTGAQTRLLGRIKTIFEPYVDDLGDSATYSPSIVDGHLPTVPSIEDGNSQAWFRAGHIHRFESWADAERFIQQQSSHLDRETRESRVAAGRSMWHRGSGRYTDGLDAALTPALLHRVADEVNVLVPASGSLRKNKLKAKRLRIGVGILSSLLDARKHKLHRFYKTVATLAVCFDEPAFDAANFTKRTLERYYDPFFRKVDKAAIRSLRDQKWPATVYEPTALGLELLALSPPHPSPISLAYTSAEPNRPLALQRTASSHRGRSGSNPWARVLAAAKVE